MRWRDSGGFKDEVLFYRESIQVSEKPMGMSKCLLAFVVGRQSGEKYIVIWGNYLYNKGRRHLWGQIRNEKNIKEEGCI